MERPLIDQCLKSVVEWLTKLDTSFGNIYKEEGFVNEKEQNFDSVYDNSNHKTDSNTFSRANFKTKIPLPIGKVKKAGRRLNLTSHENE